MGPLFGSLVHFFSMALCATLGGLFVEGASISVAFLMDLNNFLILFRGCQRKSGGRLITKIHIKK